MSATTHSADSGHGHAEASKFHIFVQLAMILAVITGVLRRHAALDPDSYPFILKAAHELAVVGRDDQREIEAALEQELLNRGMRPRYSPKQAAKNRE